jgi:predicted nucleic acid-binding protein
VDGVRHQRDTEQATLILVLNATPIIYLCKAGLAEKLVGLKPSYRLLTTQEVYEEVYVKGIEKGVREAGALKGVFDGGIVEVGPPKEGSKKVKDLSQSSGIHPGEVSVISLALELGATAILDDRRARQVARVLGVGLSGTPGIVIELVRRRTISKEEARLALEKMVEEGWYCSAKVFSSMVKAIDEET